VSGCDHESAALEAASANAAANGVELRLARVNLRDELPPIVATVVANLTAPLLAEVAARLPAPPRRLVCSGMMSSELDQVVAAFGSAGLVERKRRIDGDWAALLLGPLG
jgi:ribosomal protein L11 methylase PrmA